MRTYQYNIAQEMLIDNFAGGGGASTGIELATGHFHCRRKSDDKLFQFYAGTGKIVGVSNKRGIHEFIKLLSN